MSRRSSASECRVHSRRTWRYSSGVTSRASCSWGVPTDLSVMPGPPWSGILSGYDRRMQLVCRLQDLGKDDGGLAGGKAANLGELLRAGLPVPQGFVVTTAAYEHFLAAGGLR